MENTSAYQIIFSGQLRQGFNQAPVGQALADRLKLPPQQLVALFTGKPVVLVQSDSAEEAKQWVAQLAELGAITRIRNNRPAKPSTPADVTTTKLPRFSPYPRGWKLTAGLIVAATGEVFFALLYIFLLFAFSVGLIYYSLFTNWGIHISSFGPLALALQAFALLSGLLVLFLLVKPFRAINPHHRKGVVVDAEHEPDLYAFVEDVCERINAPMPQQISIINTTEVSLYYIGVDGFLRNRHLLTIGAPLVAACDTSQLAALIAQSLQLFHNRRLSPRAAFLLRAIDGWLQRAIYGKDAIDRSLEDLAHRSELLGHLTRPLQKLIAWSRKLLGLRLRFSRYLNRRLMHRLVADADKVALIFCGSEGFVHLLERQRLLAHTAQRVLPNLRKSWQSEGELPDDIVQALVLLCKQYQPTIHQQLREKQAQQKALSHDTIPADSQRLHRVSNKAVKGAYSCYSPASTLFHDFDKLSRSMTIKLYYNRLGIPVPPHQLVPAAHPEKTVQQQQLIDAIFQGFYNDFVSLKLDHALGLMDSAESERNRRDKAMQDISTNQSHLELTQKRYIENNLALIDVSIHEVIQEAGLWRQWEVERETAEGLEHIRGRVMEQQRGVEEQLSMLTHYTHPYVIRLTASLGMLNTSAATKIKDSERLLREVRALVQTMEGIDKMLPHLYTLRLHTTLLLTLLSHNLANKGRVDVQSNEVRGIVTKLGVGLRTTPYPFGKTYDNLMSYALSGASTDVTPEGDYDRGCEVVSQITQLRSTIVARLCAIALYVEKSIGLAG
ncbi:MAG: M48 family metallopeptidase [Chromatiales bacterium]|nr:M48 family metallopeptidase [Chromatiales bacterium]